ncbi:hydrogenase formation protein HypD [Campylobacter sp. 19-13652]|uniref:hydrogenase formation protein HypD n=1 Tax=Campylobacter sp. 19-13652 TaxID=2840180 RepID=UPI001C7471E2|nr:hydrogenase formation protein HypD [Campylobacter sp. 19-13652]BCX79609.1 hydrogenase expression/formation protein [Campylobacter sp. 19-13652]
MDLINDYRNSELILALAKQIKAEAATLSRPINIMEICGGHTHSIMKFALGELVEGVVNFIHGPGCPVCIMPVSRIDEACELASMQGVIFCTLADMLRVPGSHTSLLKLRGLGHDIRALYTPLDALKIARQNPDKNVIFFAIGFETTTPMSAVIIQKALDEGVKNLYFHINHVTVPAPLRAIMADKNVNIDGFLGPSHVSVIVGSNAYKELALEFKRPIAISGFEPVDVMASVLNLIRQHKRASFEVFNEYKRAVSAQGNVKAKELVAKYMRPCTFEWRGLGEIDDSGLCLKDEYVSIDARRVFALQKEQATKEAKACICGQILRGVSKPPECALFAKACTPNSPVGACMVSSEGACAAYYKYQRRGA